MKLKLRDKICALVVCYNDYEATLRCAAAILSQSVAPAHLYIFDNSSCKFGSHKISNLKNVSVISQATNIGISGAYELVFKEAIKENYEWCWTFDQDSVPHHNALEELLIRSKGALRNERTGIVASTGISARNGALYRGNNASWVQLKKPNRRRCLYKCDLSISAGSLTKLSYFRDHGYSFSGMFIDWIDFEICMDMKRNGYNIYSCQTSFFDHYIGGDETASYTQSEEEADGVSEMRQKFLIINSISVILRSRGVIKYPYLVFHLFNLARKFMRRNPGFFFQSVGSGISHALNS